MVSLSVSAWQLTDESLNRRDVTIDQFVGHRSSGVITWKYSILAVPYQLVYRLVDSTMYRQFLRAYSTYREDCGNVLVLVGVIIVGITVPVAWAFEDVDEESSQFLFLVYVMIDLLFILRLTQRWEFVLQAVQVINNVKIHI